MNRRRLRTFTLWTGALLSLLIAAAFVVSAWWAATVQLPNWGTATVASGEVSIWVNFFAGSGIRRHEIGLSYWNDWRFESAPLPSGNTIRIILIPLWPEWR